MKESKFIWMDGRLVPWRDAKVHVLVHGLHYGTGVFEGMRCYETSKGPAIFRLGDHISRLFRSAAAYGMKIPFTPAQLVAACKRVVRENRLSSCYIRPIAFYGYGEVGLNPRPNPINVAIAAFAWPTYLGKIALERGVRSTISSWRRIDRRSFHVGAKATANYLNSALAKEEALDRGYDEAIMLNYGGKVAEGPGENIFMVKSEVVITPPESAGILMGITRDSILRIAKDLGLKVAERNITPAQLKSATEAFYSGTAAEISPIREIDGKKIGNGKRGPITERLQSIFFRAARGEEPRYRSWLEFV